MELNQVIEYLSSTTDCDPNLIKSRACITALNLKPTYPIILIGGTNGKGSVCAYLSTILTQGGYLVGSFTSPHVFKYNERICINTQPIDDEILTNVLEQIINNWNQHQLPNLGIFKAFMLAAHLIFIQKKVDIAVIEVGIGGRHDITNLFEPLISAITNVELDHCELLGNTLEAIGREKSGIFRPGKYSFFGDDTPPISLIEYAQEIGTKFERFGINFGITRHNIILNDIKDNVNTSSGISGHNSCFDVWCGNKKYYSLPYPSLRGDNQPKNVALSLAILNKLQHQFPLSISTIKSALLNTNLIGRFQVMPGLPQIILDVAHNPHAITNMLQNMLKLPFNRQTIAVFGIAKDKDAEQVIQLCSGYFEKWFIAKTKHDRGLTTQYIAAMLKNNLVLEQNIIQCVSIAEACIKAYQYSCARIICFGSFLVVEEAYTTISNMRK
ncbi:MAG: hypothetical protein KBD37_00550 [Burkholderiales bacterium]|nr:hypothetical protein [Burkholderiales bacterium]